MIETNPQNMVEQILPYERGLFLWLNEFHNAFWDSFMWMYSGKATWILLVLVGVGIFFYKTKWQQAIWIVICLVLLGVLCDQLSASVIKPIFERLRPTYHPDFKAYVHIVNSYRGGRFGFISAHAANGFGIATFMSLMFKYRRFTIVIFSWATVTAYSRIYLGVHFISDVVGGMFLGILMGTLIYYLFQYGRIRLLKQTPEEIREPAYSVLRANIVCITIGVIVVTLFIISFMNFMWGFGWFF